MLFVVLRFLALVLWCAYACLCFFSVLDAFLMFFFGFHRFLTLSYACQMIFWLVSMCFLLFFPDVCLMFFCWFSSLPYAFFCVLMIAYRFPRFSVWFPCDVLMVFLMIALWYYYLVLCFAYAFFVLSLCVSFCVSDVFLWFCLYFFWCPFPFFTHFIMLCLMRVFDCVLLLLWCLDVFIMRFLWLPYVVLLFSSFSYVCSGFVHPWS